MPCRTFIASKKKSVCGFSVSIDSLTILLGAKAAEDFKLKPVSTYHPENPRVLKNKNDAKSALLVLCKCKKKPG